MRVFPRTLGGLLGAVLLLSFPSCDYPQRSLREKPKPAAPRAGVANSVAPVFDLPALAPLTADQVQARLGKPISDERESINEEVKTLTYRRRGYELSIDYEVRSRRLLDLYLIPLQSWQAYEQLLHAANLVQAPDTNGQGYTVSPLNEAKGLYEGLSVTPDSARVMDHFGHWVPK